MKTRTMKIKETDGKFLWEFRSENKIQLWPSDDKQRYITPPTALFPKACLRSKNIVCPPKLPIDLTAREGILASAFSRHGKKYFVSHMGEDFITFIVMTHGQYCAKTKAETYNIGEGMCFALPAKIPCDYFTRFDGFKLIWFHIKNTPQWRRVFGNSIRCQKMMSYEQFTFLYNLYAKELYSETRSLAYLRNVLQLIIETIRREFFGDEKPSDACSEKFHNLIVSLNADLNRPWDAKTAAAKLKVDVQKLNSQFRLIYGKTFAKFLLGLRMERALKMLESGHTLREIAPAVGFATAYSLSNTFKDFYGASPKTYMKNK